MSFGVGEDSGYIYSAKVRAPTLEETASFEKKKAESELKRSQDRRVTSIGKNIMDKGERPVMEGDRIKLEGRTILDTRTIYGGGSHFVVEPDNKTVWFVRNNGADGDNWAWSNVSPSGIGWKLKDEKLAQELSQLHSAKKDRKDD